jgi:hypothetical protein
VLSRFGYLHVLVCAVVFALPGAGAADSTTGMRIDWSFPEGPTRTHSDLAMWGNIVVAGNYDGFRVFDISQTGANRLLVNYLCRGPQNDVSLWEHNGRLLLYLSNDTPQTNGETVCSQNRGSDTTACGTACFEGIRIFDLTDPASPVLLKGVYTDCGSHTHTLIPDPANNRLLLYVSSYPSSTGPRCQYPHAKISIVEVPLDAPESASVIAQPTIDAPQYIGVGCHDITVFLPFHIAAASCLSEGQLWDITDPANPGTLSAVHLDNVGVSVWHSAAFTWDRQYVVFDDEDQSNGTCQPSNHGKIWIYRVSDGQLMSSYMIPRPQGSYCSVHNGNIIPVVGRYLFVAAWYGGGTSVVEFTNPSQPHEIAYYKATTGRGIADTWSSYWYNGKIYANDITRGLDVFDLALPKTPYGYPWTHLNAQTQEMMYPPPIGSLTSLARLTRSASAP